MIKGRDRKQICQKLWNNFWNGFARTLPPSLPVLHRTILRRELHQSKPCARFRRLGSVLQVSNPRSGICQEDHRLSCMQSDQNGVRNCRTSEIANLQSSSNQIPFLDSS